MAIKQVTLQELASHVAGLKVKRGIEEVVLHHTWSPTAAQYRGQPTWDGIRRYHMQERGWSDIGYHVGVGPDGSIWLLRPVERSGAHVLNRNQHTIGVALVGNFDVEDPVRNGLPVAAQVVKVLVDRFRLHSANIRFHREFQNKTCPGTKVDLHDFRLLVGQSEGKMTSTAKQATVNVKVCDHATGKVLAVLQMAPGGNHILDQGKIYVTRMEGTGPA